MTGISLEDSFSASRSKGDDEEVDYLTDLDENLPLGSQFYDIQIYYKLLSSREHFLVAYVYLFKVTSSPFKYYHNSNYISDCKYTSLHRLNLKNTGTSRFL